MHTSTKKWLFTKISSLILIPLMIWFLINFVSSNMNIDLETKQSLLEETDFEKRANSFLKYLTKELQILEMKNKIQSKVKIDLDKQQKEYLLNQIDSLY